MDNILLSGGAKGSDIYWGKIASQYKHEVMHFSFVGHRSIALESTIYRLSNEELSYANDKIKNANLTLKRRIPVLKQWIYNLLRRNWYQVRDAKSIYAVGRVSSGSTICDVNSVYNTMRKLKKYEDILCVSGGTARAV